MNHLSIHFKRVTGSIALAVAAIVACCVLYSGRRARDRYASYEADDGRFGCSCTPVSAGDQSCVFSTPASGRGDIYKAFLREKRFIPFVETAETEYAPVLSPDGRKIAFVRHDLTLGTSQIWLRDTESGLETMLSKCGPDDSPLQISDDGSYLLATREFMSGGMTRKSRSVVISTETRAQEEISETPAFIWSKMDVLCTQGSDLSRNVVVYDVRRKSFAVLCEGQLVLPIDYLSVLVRKRDGQLCVVDNVGRVLRTMSSISTNDLVACGGGWIASTDSSRSRIIVQQLDGRGEAVHLPIVGAEWEIRDLGASAFGFTVVVCKSDLRGWNESVVTTSPPFAQWEWRFSASELRWY